MVHRIDAGDDGEQHGRPDRDGHGDTDQPDEGFAPTAKSQVQAEPNHRLSASVTNALTRPSRTTTSRSA